MLLWVIMVILVCALLGAPSFGPIISHGYGWYPSGTFGVVLVILLVLVLLGRL